MKASTIIATAVVLVLAVTNPGRDSYNGWVKQQLAQQGAGGAVVAILVPASLIDGSTTRSNFVLFSVYDTKVADSYSIRTIGVLGNFISIGTDGNSEAPRPLGNALSAPASGVSSRLRPDPRRVPLPPPAPVDSDEQKCVKSIISRTEGHFLPVAEPQILAIEQDQGIKAGPAQLAYCRHTAVVAKFDPISKRYIPVWQTDMAAPGLVFSGGYWHKQPSILHADVKAVSVLPAPYDGMQQIFIYTHDETADGGWSSAEIVAFTTPYGNTVTLLKVRQHGGMDIKIQNRTITINGYYIAPDGCNACGEPRSLSLRFDPIVRQLAIVNPDQKSVEFFRYLTGAR